LYLPGTGTRIERTGSGIGTYLKKLKIFLVLYGSSEFFDFIKLKQI
jgi:hypothetical protein